MKIEATLIILGDGSLMLVRSDGYVISYGQSETGYVLVNLLDGTIYFNYVPKEMNERRHLC